MRRVGDQRRQSLANRVAQIIFFSIPFLLVLLSHKAIHDTVEMSSFDDNHFILSFDKEDSSLPHRPVLVSNTPRSDGKPISSDNVMKKEKSYDNEKVVERTNMVQVIKMDKPWMIIKTAQFRNTGISKMNLTGKEELDVHDPPFQRFKNVVITTKVHWSKDLGQLKRMLCTLNAAYNRFVNYDIVVFTTMPWSDEEVETLAKIVAPSKLTVSIDGPPLEKQLASMTKEEVNFLKRRCNVKADENITWFHHCKEENYTNPSNLAYAFQSEFRAYHIYKHPVMQKYKWMIWLDSDALCTKTWESDPMKIMVENNLTVMYDNFPAGSTKGNDLKSKMVEAYGRSICGIWETDQGHWFTRDCQPQHVSWVVQIHGFHHISNLDVYRSEKHKKFLKLMVGDYRFSRKWDDQLAITVPAAFEAPERVWDLRKHNMTWMIRHNGEYDGKDRYKIQNPTKWWIQEGRNWTAGRLFCDSCMKKGEFRHI